MLDRGQAVNVFAYTCTVNLIDKSSILSLFSDTQHSNRTVCQR